MVDQATTVLDLRTADELVLHFGGHPKTIDAYTFAQGLLAIRDAVKAINDAVDPFEPIELTLEAIGPGSFRAKVKSRKKTRRNGQWKSDVRNVILGILASIIYDHAFKGDDEVVINVTSDEYVVQQGDKQIVLPREVEGKRRDAEASPAVRENVGKFFQVLENDPEVSSFAIVQSLDAEAVPFDIPRERFRFVRESVVRTPEPHGSRRIESYRFEDAVLTRAILQRGPRKWEFIWRGFRISARIADDRFFDALEHREVAVRHSDVFVVDIEIHQRFDPSTSAYVNEEYVITNVHKISPPPEQPPLI